MKITIFNIILMFCIAALSFAEDKGYDSITIINGNNTTTTYIDRGTNATYGNRGYRTGNVTKNDGSRYGTIHKTNNNITTHTYTNKSTGAVTGGSTWKSGNTTRSYGTSPPHPYDK